MTLLDQVYDHLRQSRLVEAERLLLDLAQRTPGDPAVHRARAVAAQMGGRVDAAIDALGRAVALAPDVPMLRLEFGQLLGSAQRGEEALMQFQAATALQPDQADAWYLLGMTLYGLRRDADALPAFRRALALAPTHPLLQRALAETEYALELHAEALPRYEHLLAAQPDDPMLHLRLSQCLRRLGMPERAANAVAAALDRFPGDATLWLEAGWVHEDLGDAARAQTAYTRAHALRPDWGDPVASAIALGRADAPEYMVRTAQAMVTDPRMPETERAYLHHVLGKHEDARGEHAGAARHWDEANHLRRALEGAFDRDAYVAMIDATIATFTPDLLARLHRDALADERPVFVLGMPRSGTTLAEQILAAHPLVHGGGELTGIVRIAQTLPQETGLRWPQEAARVDTGWLQAAARRYLADAARPAPPDARRLVDKQPYNFLHVGLIAMLFADARVVWCRRDPRDIALSIYSESFSPLSNFATDLDDIAFVIAEQERLMRHWCAVSPVPILEFDYETVVADTETQVRRLVDFAGLPWDERSLAFHASGRAVQTLSRWQVRQPVHARSVGRWRNYPQWFGAD